ncbi:hypothetical protein, partial [Acinetobacter baumannii]|uniref:hypothetical protein n=1 Tax=Acinetobacter baumannii TaxID=470 RepID=UPI0038B68C1A
DSIYYTTSCFDGVSAGIATDYTIVIVGLCRHGDSPRKIKNVAGLFGGVNVDKRTKKKQLIDLFLKF